MGPGEVKRKDPKQKERKMIFTISQSKNGRWILSFRGRRVLGRILNLVSSVAVAGRKSRPSLFVPQ
jgi:hypothetical protein